MTDNPYRFIVKVSYAGFSDTWWVGITADDITGMTDDRDLPAHIWLKFDTEADANAHADMVLAALQGATRG